MSIIQLSNNFRIRYDTSANQYYLEYYDSSTASWNAVVTVDPANNSLTVDTADITNGNITTATVGTDNVTTANIGTANITYLKSTNVSLNISNSGTPNITWSPFMTPNQGTQVLPVYMQYSATGVGTTETITITVTPYYSDGSTAVIQIAEFTGDVSTTNATQQLIPNAVKNGVYINQIDVSANTTSTTSVATVTIDIVAYQI